MKIDIIETRKQALHIRMLPSTICNTLYSTKKTLYSTKKTRSAPNNAEVVRQNDIFRKLSLHFPVEPCPFSWFANYYSTIKNILA